MENVFKTVCAAIAGFVVYVFGAPDIWLIALVIAIIADYMTGLCKAFIAGELSSKAGLKGIIKKLMYFAIVAVGVMIDNISGAGGILRTAVIGFLIANEALSILENCAAAGLPVPKMLIKVLNRLKDDADQGKPVEAKEKE